MELPSAPFGPSSRKSKNLPRIKFLIFQETEFLSSNIQKFHEMETPQKISDISGNENPEKASYISGNRTFQSTPGKFVILQEMKTSKKFLYFLKRKLFLYSGK